MNNDPKNNEIDISNFDLEKDREKIAENPSLLPYAHTVGGVVIKPEDEGKIKGRAVQAMREQTDMHMGQIYEQMQLLANQAKELKERVVISERIYQAAMRFEPIISYTYYLYEQENGTDTISLIAPHEWGRSKKFKNYLAKVRLLADHTWEILESHLKL
ncbi:MAG: DUF2452 domain-containing protein [Bacteroidetes bacterium]|nr:MAG: DUF2452 domain-containing protein [Bacteroidota bacterium]